MLCCSSGSALSPIPLITLKSLVGSGTAPASVLEEETSRQKFEMGIWGVFFLFECLPGAAPLPSTLLRKEETIRKEGVFSELLASFAQRPAVGQPGPCYPPRFSCPVSNCLEITCNFIHFKLLAVFTLLYIHLICVLRVTHISLNIKISALL